MKKSYVSLNIPELNKDIEEYYQKNGKEPYIIMSDTTANLLASTFEYRGNKKGFVSLYRGFTVLRDNSLEVGEIDVR